MTKNNIAAVIMAGGQGKRFWPLSSPGCPKQFVDLTGAGQSMIQETYRRLRSWIPADRVYVVTHCDQAQLVRKHLPELRPHQILAEPYAKNTAPCVAWAAVHVSKDWGDPVMLVVPADQFIERVTTYRQDLRQACRFAARTRSLVTFGIPPRYPETGYGYIQRGEKRLGSIYQAKRFREKPGPVVARRYCRQGNYFWNSGMFVFRSSVFIEALRSHAPKVYVPMMHLRQKLATSRINKEELKKIYQRCPSISIDVAVMEKSRDVVVSIARFKWSDIGSWTAVADLMPVTKNGNQFLGGGQAAFHRTQKSFVLADEGELALVGVSNIIVVKHGKKILICHKSTAQSIKEIGQ